jgi:hypothetical protein
MGAGARLISSRVLAFVADVFVHERGALIVRESKGFEEVTVDCIQHRLALVRHQIREVGDQRVEVLERGRHQLEVLELVDCRQDGLEVLVALDVVDDQELSLPRFDLGDVLGVAAIR